MIKQAFAKNYMPSGGNYKYYKINDRDMIQLIVNQLKLPVIDVIIEGELLSFMEAIEHNFSEISALRTDNSYHYLTDVSEIVKKPDSYIFATGDVMKALKSMVEFYPTPPSKEEWDEVLSRFQEISKGEYEAMIKK